MQYRTELKDSKADNAGVSASEVRGDLRVASSLSGGSGYVQIQVRGVVAVLGIKQE